MAVYDLMLKLEGLKALCGDGVTDDHLNYALFYPKELQDRRSSLSRLKSGKLDFTERLKSILTEEFNVRIVNNVLGGNAKPDGSGLLRNEDWERPLPEFFGYLAKVLDARAPTALSRAHSGIIAALHRLEEYRERDHALLVASYDVTEAERFRFPDSAPPVDPADLPLARIRVGRPMTAALVRVVNDEPARCWLFYVRNPDERQGLSQSHYVWDQDLSQMVYWHPDGPFEIPTGFIGALPGFPTVATRKTGMVTAFLLVEPLASHAVTDLLRAPTPAWDGKSPPSFEGFANLVTAGKRLFQRGNVSKLAKGTLSFQPPKLFVRRYKIDA
jgi:hypothetical protein